MLIKVDERLFQAQCKLLADQDAWLAAVEAQAAGLTAGCEQLAGYLSWFADEAFVERRRTEVLADQVISLRNDLSEMDRAYRDKVEECDAWRASQYASLERIRELEGLIDDMGVVKVDGRRAVDVHKDIRTKIAALEQQVREYQRRVTDLSQENLGRISEASQLAQTIQALRQTNELLTQRLFEANDRLKRAGSLVGGVVSGQALANAAIRLADAFVAVTDRMMGNSLVIGADAAVMNQELETASRDYRHEKGRS